MDSQTLGYYPGTPLTQEVAELILEGNKNYFTGENANPYSWFNAVQDYALSPIGAFYGTGSAAHVDLVQWATDPVWSDIEDETTRQALIEEDIEFLRELFQLKKWDAIIINGSLAIDTLTNYGMLEIKTTETQKVHDKSRTFITGTRAKSNALGFSVNLPNPWTSTITKHYVADWLRFVL